MSATRLQFIPALGYRFLTPLYDPLLQWGLREGEVKGRLIERADIRPGQHVLDIGCGTGTLALMIKRALPSAHVSGLDADPVILDIARRKALRANLEIQWERASADDLPYPDDSFDVVVSSLMIHHLSTPQKLAMFRQACRVLRRSGSLHVLDVGPAYDLLTRIQGALLQRLEHVGDNFAGRLVPLLRDAGFDDVDAAEPIRTILAPLWYYSAVKGSRGLGGGA